MQPEDFRAAKPLFASLPHFIPFAALMARNAHAEVNRPFATRLIEQAVVAVIAGGGSAYGVAEVTQARHDEQIKSLQVQFERNSAALQRQFERSEDRLMREIQIIRDGKNGR